jgi:hypothetical protein
MTHPNRPRPPEPMPAPALPRTLTEYAEQLLLGTGLGVADAVRVASGQADPPAELRGLAEALRAGWTLAEEEA